jgi:hypothetical protein
LCLKRQSFLHAIGQPLPNSIQKQPRCLGPTPKLLADGREREFLHEAPLDNRLLVRAELLQALPQGRESPVVFIWPGVERGEFQFGAFLFEQPAGEARLALVAPPLVATMVQRDAFQPGEEVFA